MTRRERLENKLQKREEWAAKAEQRAAARFRAADAATEGIPFGQPILVGHHSEKRHRNAVERGQRNGFKGVEEMRLAEHHTSKADGLAHQLDRSIFSDDPDALDALADRVEALEQKRQQMKAANAWWRKHQTMQGFPGLTDEQAARLDADIPQRYSFARQPFPAYTLSNLGGRIRAAKERAKLIEIRSARAAKAEAAGGVSIEYGKEWCRVTFAEKPSRDVLQSLRNAGYSWGGGSWSGPIAKLPPNISAPVDQPTPEAITHLNGVRITATAASVDEANAYMATHPTEAVLAEVDGVIYIADVRDKGNSQ